MFLLAESATAPWSPEGFASGVSHSRHEEGEENDEEERKEQKEEWEENSWDSRVLESSNGLHPLGTLEQMLPSTT